MFSESGMTLRGLGHWGGAPLRELAQHGQNHMAWRLWSLPGFLSRLSYSSPLWACGPLLARGTICQMGTLCTDC